MATLTRSFRSLAVARAQMARVSFLTINLCMKDVRYGSHKIVPSHRDGRRGPIASSAGQQAYVPARARKDAANVTSGTWE